MNKIKTDRKQVINNHRKRHFNANTMQIHFITLQGPKRLLQIKPKIAVG